MARTIIGPDNFIEVFVKASLALCEERDVKGFYQKARQGLIKDFTGIDSPFEEPRHPDLVLDTTSDPVEQTIQRMIDYIIPLLQYRSA